MDGDATFQSIFEGISKAKDFVLVQFYIIEDDEVGRELKTRLMERAKAGVRCYLLYDEIGTRLPRAYTEELKQAGIPVFPFNTRQGEANRFQINFRNHRKIVITDGRAAWVGGLNVGREYKGLDPDFGYWRDTHLRLAGPVVQSVQVSFMEDWQWASGGPIEGLNWDPQPAASGVSRPVLCLPSGPADSLESCTLFFLNAINMAKAGIKVYRDTQGFMHHKVVVVDDDYYCTVGTANFDNRSFRLNFEITMAFADRDFTRLVTAMLENDLSHARLVRPGELQEYGFWFRLAVQAARLTAPVQ